MSTNCSSNSSTLAHEIGHYFGLWHTHSTTNGAEYVNGTNCQSSGDILCDTPADPTLSSSTVDRTSCAYIGAEVDVNGDAYTPATNNIMSYSTKFCRINFSAGQLARMEFFYLDVREEQLNSSLAPHIFNCPCDERPLTVHISSDNRDVEQKSNGELVMNSPDLEMVSEASDNTNQTVGLRFTNINLLANSSVNEAYIQFVADESNQQATTLDPMKSINFNS